MRCGFRLRALAACAAILTAPHVVAAQDQRAVLEMIVNAVPKGEAFVVIRDADVLVGVQRLGEAGIRGFAGTRESLDGEEMVALSSLSDGLSFSVDERDLRLILTAAPTLLGTNVQTFGGNVPPDMIYRSDPSAFLNYAVAWNQPDGGTLFGESGVNLRGALVHSTFSAGHGGPRRGITGVTVDDRRRMRRWVFGDAFARTGPLGGDAWSGGITLTREFGIEPYFVRHPTLSMSTPVSVPSTVEVHVNGRMVSSEQVEPGRLDIEDLPLTVGRNDARLVVRDAFGRSQELTTTYYVASSVLAPGLHDYQYSLGFRRAELGSASWAYREPVALARHRVGVREWITAGGRAEASPDVLSLGPSVNIRVPFGEIDADAAISAGREGYGTAVAAGYTYGGRPLSAGGSLMAATQAYATVNPRPRDQRAAFGMSVFASTALRSGIGLTAQHGRTSLHGGLSRSRTALLATRQFGRDVQLTASVARGRDETGAGNEAFIGLGVQFGRASTSTSVAVNRTSTSIALDAQQPLPVGIGYGYQARVESGPPGASTGAVQYQGPYGRYELRHDAIGGTRRASVNAAGAIVAIGGGIFASRPVHQSFALLRVPGVEGVRGYASNQEVGRTNADGDLLVPDLQPYYGNLLNISDSDIPLDYSVGGVRLTLALPYRGGGLALFPVALIRRITGTIRIVDGSAERVPEYGELRLTPHGASEEIVSPVGATGEFYFENLPPGRLDAVVEDAMGSCAFTLAVAGTEEPLTDLGEIRCASAQVSR